MLGAYGLPGSSGCVFALIGGLGSNSDAAGGVAAIGMVLAQLLLFVILLVLSLIQFRSLERRVHYGG